MSFHFLCMINSVLIDRCVVLLDIYFTSPPSQWFLFRSFIAITRGVISTFFGTIEKLEKTTLYMW